MEGAGQCFRAAGLVLILLSRRPRGHFRPLPSRLTAQARRIADDVAVFWVRGGAGTVIEHGGAADVFERPRHELAAAYVSGLRG